jgi:hypothetical protein
MIEDPQVDAYAFRSRVCLGIAAIGFVILLVGLFWNVL